ncbi:MAG: hypothetical protein GXP24_05025 [Planctomycetes bacterium]|nr:hypothetical protein [Planctomycetota bacterium]
MFRYALEHWHPDPYRAVILHRGTLSEEDEKLVAKLEAMPTDPNTSANMIVRRVDVEQDEESPDLTELLGPDYRESLESPEIALLYPQGSLSGPLAWRGRLTAENVDALVRSPARSQITDWILAGESAVWVLVGAGDAVADKLAEETLRTQLDLLENELKLRDMEIIEAESQFGKETKVELRLGLKLLVLDRTDPKEKIFAAMLLRSEENLEELGQPVAIPVYGRGRAFLALAGKGIKRRNIEESCRFLIGDCSCEVKRQNPGVDLLFALNWDEQVVGSAGVDPTLPDLVGIGLYSEVSLDEPSSEPNSDPANPQTEESDKNPTIDTQQDKTPPVTLHVARESAETPDSFSTADETASGSSSFGQRLTLWLALLIALGVVFAAIATVRLRL